MKSSLIKKFCSSHESTSFLQLSTHAWTFIAPSFSTVLHIGTMMIFKQRGMLHVAVCVLCGNSRQFYIFSYQLVLLRSKVKQKRLSRAFKVDAVGDSILQFYIRRNNNNKMFHLARYTRAITGWIEWEFVKFYGQVRFWWLQSSNTQQLS